jgi:endonuclease-8
MEGPSLVIATEELSQFLNKKISKAIVPKSIKPLTGKKLVRVESWGKHLLLIFDNQILRIHFLMFGSYRINNPRENRIPKLQIDYKNDTLYFYSCAIREISKEDLKAYDHSVDLMSEEWDHKKALKTVREKESAFVCDVLMDQAIFSGLGNIMKNEIQFRCKIHPEQKIGELSAREQGKLVKESKQYAHDFYEWKKMNQLKRHWLIMRKKTCPVCGRKVIKRPTGKLKRLSHYCNFCQKKRSA